MKVLVSESIKKYLPKDKYLEAAKQIKQKVSANIANNFYRIKPVRTVTDEKCYELRMHLGSNNYRLAFSVNNNIATVFYLSENLEKKTFDKEVKKQSQKE